MKQRPQELSSNGYTISEVLSIYVYPPFRKPYTNHILQELRKNPRDLQPSPAKDKYQWSAINAD